MKPQDAPLTVIDTVELAKEWKERIEEHAADWATNEEPFDAEDYLDRLETNLDLDLGSEMDSPWVLLILKWARTVRRESRA